MGESATKVVICMGSSCFARGNNHNAERIMQMVQQAGVKEAVEVTGTLCQNRCKQGPNVEIQGECHCGVTPETLPQILEGILKGSEVDKTT